MEHTSRKTSNALKYAGFPQPQKSNAGFWWIGSGDHRWPMSYLTHRIATHGNCWLSDIDGAVYSPSALEIMSEISPGLMRKIALYRSADGWMVKIRGKIFSHPNPAEALAMAYIHLRNETTP